MQIRSVQRTTSITNQCCASITANLSRFIDGMMLAWSTTVIPSLGDPNAAHPMTSNQIGWIMSIVGVGAMFGPIVTWLAIDRIGRKMTMLMSVVPMIGSFLIMTFREDYPFLLIGRILAGVGIGLSVSSTPLYIGEVSENRIRGAMSVIGVICTSIGHILILIIGPYITLQWLNMICAISAVMVLFALSFIPESPYYYLMKDDMKNATKSLSWLRSKANVETELKAMKDYVENTKRQKSSTFDLFTNGANRRPFLILLMLSLMQTFGGSVAMSTYAYSIFEDSGYKLSLHTLVIIMGMVSMIASFGSLFTVDIIGRRPLLFLGSACMTISLIGNGIFYTLKSQDYDVSQITLFPFFAIIGYVISMSFGIHSLAFIVLSEYFSTNVKAKAAMCFTMFASLSSSASIKFFQLFNDAFGLGPVFFICSCPVIIFGPILFFVMPETKGRSLQKIQDIHSGASDVTKPKIIDSIEPYS